MSDGLVSSPDGSLWFELALNEAGEPGYTVSRDGVALTGPGRLGVDRVDTVFSAGLALVDSSDPELKHEVYELVVGKRRSYEIDFVERTFVFRAASGHGLELIVRVFDDGVGFRYRFPERSDMAHTVTREATTFAVPGARCWLQPQEAPARTAPAYEAAYKNEIAVDDAVADHGWTMPALFRTDDHWVVIAEAGLDGGFCGSRLSNPVAGEFSVLFPQPGEGCGIGEVEPTSTLPWVLPWRVIITSPDLATVAESGLITHLSPSSRIDDPSWIRPGRVTWSWWSDNASPRDPTALRRFVDFAAEMTWEYHLIDANWNLVEPTEIRQLIDDARARDVGTFLWYNSGGPHNIVAEQPRDRMGERDRRRSEFAEIASWGVAGVKIDFFHSDKQDRIEQYRDILEDAAAAKLMVNFHGCTVPRGWEREWPNLMTMEGVRGAEQYQAQFAYPIEAPVLLTIFPFTRNLVGSMDYTPVTFSDNRYPHLTTGAFELALAVLVESGLQHFADSPEAYRRLAPEALAALAAVPTAWDETILLDAWPGHHCTLARRHGADWWIAAINGTNEALELDLDLRRLDLLPGTTLQLLSDGPTPSRDGSQITTTELTVSEPPTLPLQLPAFGGALCHLLEVPPRGVFAQA